MISSMNYLNCEYLLCGFVFDDMSNEIIHFHFVNWSRKWNSFIRTLGNQVIMTLFFSKNWFQAHFSDNNSSLNFSNIVCLLIINMSWSCFWIIQASNSRFLVNKVSFNIELSIYYKVNEFNFCSCFYQSLSSLNLFCLNSKN